MTTLNIIQQQSYTKAQQLARILRKSKRIYSKVAPFQDEVSTFLTHLDSIAELATIKAKKGIAITAQKRTLKKELAREVSDVCTLATAYALKTKNIVLREQLRSTSYTDIYTTKDILIKPAVLCILHHITPLLSNKVFARYGITNNDITSISEKADRFSSVIFLGKMVNWDSNYASQTITATFNKISATIKQMQRLLTLFKKTHPGFIEEFRGALIIEEKKGSHNTIEGIVKDSHTAQPIENVTITAEGKNKQTVTDSSGFYCLSGIRGGTYRLTVSAVGYTPQTLSVRVIRGKMVMQNISLEAKQIHAVPHAEVA